MGCLGFPKAATNCNRIEHPIAAAARPSAVLHSLERSWPMAMQSDLTGNICDNTILANVFSAQQSQIAGEMKSASDIFGAKTAKNTCFVRHLPTKPYGTHVQVPADVTQVWVVKCRTYFCRRNLKIQKAFSNNINMKRGQQSTTIRDTIINCNSDDVPLSTFSLGRTSLSAPLPSTFWGFPWLFYINCSQGDHINVN